ncbi:hypothetical protein EV182_003253 [Spiromyces aspiralis]|uniref:Uncharacterized protein n=1 Tax=Spiromyces aspiralis TaxID=68401 RepID=A0ACC1HJH5_9FUNG|nr:hypothetical protein EV182_003253 [Spiromyces aspiralis]
MANFFNIPLELKIRICEYLQSIMFRLDLCLFQALSNEWGYAAVLAHLQNYWYKDTPDEDEVSAVNRFLSGGPSPEASATLSFQRHHINALVIPVGDITPEFAHESYPALRSIQLPRLAVTASIANLIRNCPSLRQLTVCEYSDAQDAPSTNHFAKTVLKAVPSLCVNLTHLKIKYISINTLHSQQLLTHLPNLQYLTISNLFLIGEARRLDYPGPASTSLKSVELGVNLSTSLPRTDVLKHFGSVLVPNITSLWIRKSNTCIRYSYEFASSFFVSKLARLTRLSIPIPGRAFVDRLIELCPAIQFLQLTVIRQATAYPLEVNMVVRSLINGLHRLASLQLLGGEGHLESTQSSALNKSMALFTRWAGPDLHADPIYSLSNPNMTAFSTDLHLGSDALDVLAGLENLRSVEFALETLGWTPRNPCQRVFPKVLRLIVYTVCEPGACTISDITSFLAAFPALRTCKLPNTLPLTTKQSVTARFPTVHLYYSDLWDKAARRLEMGSLYQDYSEYFA